MIMVKLIIYNLAGYYKSRDNYSPAKMVGRVLALPT